MTNSLLKGFLKKIQWFNEEPRSLDQGKQYVFGNKDMRFIYVRNYHDFDKQSFFRARSLGENEDETLVSSFKYPPKQFNRLGRANLKGKQVLYAAEDPTTANLEYLNTGESGRYVHLSEWRLKEKTSIQTFDIMEFPWDEPEFYNRWPNPSKEAFEDMKELFSVLKELFRKPNRYEFTAPFSHVLLYKSDMCKMIRYPSVMANSLSKCNAINIDFFDEHFEFRRVFKFRIEGKIEAGTLEGLEEPSVLMSDHSVGRIEGDKIVYCDLTEEEQKFWNYYIMGADEEGNIGFISDDPPD